jgi:hypothetical protein
VGSEAQPEHQAASSVNSAKVNAPTTITNGIYQVTFSDVTGNLAQASGPRL